MMSGRQKAVQDFLLKQSEDTCGFLGNTFYGDSLVERQLGIQKLSFMQLCLSYEAHACVYRLFKNYAKNNVTEFDRHGVFDALVQYFVKSETPSTALLGGVYELLSKPFCIKPPGNTFKYLIDKVLSLELGLRSTVLNKLCAFDITLFGDLGSYTYDNLKRFAAAYAVKKMQHAINTINTFVLQKTNWKDDELPDMTLDVMRENGVSEQLGCKDMLLSLSEDSVESFFDDYLKLISQSGEKGTIKEEALHAFLVAGSRLSKSAFLKPYVNFHDTVWWQPTNFVLDMIAAKQFSLLLSHVGVGAVKGMLPDPMPQSLLGLFNPFENNDQFDCIHFLRQFLFYFDSGEVNVLYRELTEGYIFSAANINIFVLLYRAEHLLDSGFFIPRFVISATAGKLPNSEQIHFMSAFLFSYKQHCDYDSGVEGIISGWKQAAVAASGSQKDFNGSVKTLAALMDSENTLQLNYILEKRDVEANANFKAVLQGDPKRLKTIFKAAFKYPTKKFIGKLIALCGIKVIEAHLRGTYNWENAGYQGALTPLDYLMLQLDLMIAKNNHYMVSRYIDLAVQICSTNVIVPALHRVQLLNLLYEYQNAPYFRGDFEECLGLLLPQDVRPLVFPLAGLSDTALQDEKFVSVLQSRMPAREEYDSDDSYEEVDQEAVATAERAAWTALLLDDMDKLTNELKSAKMNVKGDVLEEMKQNQTKFSARVDEINGGMSQVVVVPELSKPDEGLLSTKQQSLQLAYDNFLYRLSVRNFESIFINTTKTIVQYNNKQSRKSEDFIAAAKYLAQLKTLLVNFENPYSLTADYKERLNSTQKKWVGQLETCEILMKQRFEELEQQKQQHVGTLVVASNTLLADLRKCKTKQGLDELHVRAKALYKQHKASEGIESPEMDALSKTIQSIKNVIARKNKKLEKLLAAVSKPAPASVPAPAPASASASASAPASASAAVSASEKQGLVLEKEEVGSTDEPQSTIRYIFKLVDEMGLLTASIQSASGIRAKKSFEKRIVEIRAEIETFFNTIQTSDDIFDELLTLLPVLSMARDSMVAAHDDFLHKFSKAPGLVSEQGMASVSEAGPAADVAVQLESAQVLEVLPRPTAASQPRVAKNSQKILY